MPAELAPGRAFPMRDMHQFAVEYRIRPAVSARKDRMTGLANCRTFIGKEFDPTVLFRRFDRMQNGQIRRALIQRAMRWLEEKPDLGMAILEPRQARGQPENGKGVRADDAQGCRSMVRQDRISGHDAREGIAKRLKHSGAEGRCDEPAADTLHQRRAALGLQIAQSVADGRWGHAKFARRVGKRSGADHRLQHPQAGHRRSMSHHHLFYKK